MLINPSPLVENILGAAIEVHRTLGPGLLESTYEACLTFELMTRGGIVLLELKSVDTILPIHTAQVITYLRLLGLRQGILINFSVTRLVDGVRNILL